MNECSCIENGIFLGSIKAALNSKTRELFNINYILTIDIYPFPNENNQIKTLFISATDTINADLLSNFDTSYEFINKGQQDGAILIHCVQGISRSATIVAAYLMKKYNWTVDFTLSWMKTKRSCIQPNSGFLKQLLLYYHLNYKLDKTNSSYKLYLLSVLSSKILKENRISCLLQWRASDRLGNICYLCKFCRIILASEYNEISHKRGLNPTWHSTKSICYESNENCNRGLFVEPLPWMKGIYNDFRGKLYCLKCHAKLGSFSWIEGITCICGAKCMPAFYLLSTKIEKASSQATIDLKNF